MAEKTGIGWTDHTMNFWMGCDRVSRECEHCYIGPVMKRMGRTPFEGPMRTKNWSGPKKWDRLAEEAGERRRVFTCSLSDFFHKGADRWRDEAWQEIQRRKNLDWLVLTKRASRVQKHLPYDWQYGYENVWLGATVGVKKSLTRLPYLFDVPAKVRFVSVEPLVEPVDLTPYLPRLDWVIVGCEQAHKDKRAPMDMTWVRDLRDQCDAHGVAFFFKQYYVGNQIVTDGMLDGVVRQAWPQVK
jgi:protein gp37